MEHAGRCPNLRIQAHDFLTEYYIAVAAVLKGIAAIFCSTDFDIIACIIGYYNGVLCFHTAWSCVINYREKNIFIFSIFFRSKVCQNRFLFLFGYMKSEKNHPISGTRKGGENIGLSTAHSVPV